MFTFQLVENISKVRLKNNTAYLEIDHWDDFHFKTLFTLHIFFSDTLLQIGNVKIGSKELNSGYTKDMLPSQFTTLPDGFFSLGQSPEYYSKLYDSLSNQHREFILQAMKDVTLDRALLNRVSELNVFQDSLLRTVSISSVYGQFADILKGHEPRSEYDFSFEVENSSSKCSFDFKVDPNSIVPTNIHALIGRNGSGKTSILSTMANVLRDDDISNPFVGSFLKRRNRPFAEDELSPFALEEYFGGAVFISFSAFDKFLVPESRDINKRPSFLKYIGLRKKVHPFSDIFESKSHEDLLEEFVDSLNICMSLESKKNAWQNAIKALRTDPNFRTLNLLSLAEIGDTSHLKSSARDLYQSLSSGHSIVLLTITKLIELVEAKTIVLFDEPESHLHPPLLSSFIRALSELLTSKNGVCVIATHSPVVLQEIPQSCVFVIQRSGDCIKVERPNQETFGENVGSLTHDIFGLEVTSSGFHALLQQIRSYYPSYEDATDALHGRLGLEGKLILKAMYMSDKRD